ncbi:MAG: hypothetical protein J6Y22_10395 [Paludibacteraceae bacterium]|nr:hypothetical protein [Paludibacteraceae bacterium]
MIGKDKCKYLREIRKRIASENDIKLVTEECTYKGECKGTCPRCEAEVRYLESELDRRQKMGKLVTLAGLSLAGIACSSLLASCEMLPGKATPLPVDDVDSIVSDTLEPEIYEGDIDFIDQPDDDDPPAEPEVYEAE